MVATASFIYDWGGSDGSPGNSTDIDALGPPCIRWKLADNANVDGSNKLKRPSSGTIYSYWTQLYVKVDNADGNTIDNLRFYTSGVNPFGAGIDVKIGLQFPTKNSGSSSGYEVATGDSTSGDEMVANHSGVSSKASIFDYTVGSPLIISISESGNVMNAANETSNYLVLQMEVASTADLGDLSNVTFYVDGDEY